MRNLARTCATLSIAVLSLAACGGPALDAQQQQVEARECASLVERHVARAGGNGTITLDGQKLALDDPIRFYEMLSKLRPPSVFRMDDKRTFRYSRSALVSDLCKDKGTAPGATGAKTNSSTNTKTSTTTSTTARRTSSSPAGG